MADTSIKDNHYATLLDQAFGDFDTSGAFEGVSREAVRRLRALTTVRRLAEGALLYRRGDVRRDAYGVLDGTLMAWLPARRGGDRPIHIVGPGAWLTSPATVAGGHRLITVTANSDVHLAVLEGDAFIRLIRDEPDLWQWLARLGARNLDVVLDIVAGLLVEGALPRVAGRLIAMTARVDSIAVSQAQLAELTGLSRNTVQRTLNALEDKRLVRRGYRRLTVLDRDGLARLAVRAGADTHRL